MHKKRIRYSYEVVFYLNILCVHDVQIIVPKNLILCKCRQMFIEYKNVNQIDLIDVSKMSEFRCGLTMVYFM